MLFDHLKNQLVLFCNDSDTIRKNAVLQNEDYRNELISMVEALTPDVALEEDYLTVTSSSGLLRVNGDQGLLEYNPFSEIFDTAYWEASLAQPGKISLNSMDDDQRYIVCDQNVGVVIFTKHLEVARTFPGFVPAPAIPANGEYGAPTAALYFEALVGSNVVRYLVIVQESNHIVKIFDWDTGVEVALIGVLDTPGDGGGNLNFPTDVAYDAVGQRLLISNRAGTPPGASAANGFVDEWDISTIATPIHNSEILFFLTDGSLSRNECFKPTSVDFSNNLLWVSNGTDTLLTVRHDEFASFKFLPVLTCTRCYERASTRDSYRLADIRQIRVFRHPITSKWYVFVANNSYGTVEVFDVATGRHLNTYGFRAEMTPNPYEAPRYYGEMATCAGVQPDVQDAPDANNRDLVFLASDPTNQRAIRIDRDAYAVDSICTFQERIFPIAIELRGWSIDGNVPFEDLEVQYRISSTDTWKPFATSATISPSTVFQFRILIQIAKGDALRKYEIRKLTIVGRQV